MSQQTLLRVKTNVPEPSVTGTTSLVVLTGATNDVTYGGSGTITSPITGTSTDWNWSIGFLNTGSTAEFYYSINLPAFTGSNYDFNARYIRYSITHADGKSTEETVGIYYEYDTSISGQSFQVLSGDKIYFEGNVTFKTGSTFNFYVVPNEVNEPQTIETYDYLDLYDDIPIKLSKSFSEIQDISKRNSDYSLSLILPGSKRNNRFFENFYNVDADSLFFDVTKRV